MVDRQTFSNPCGKPLLDTARELLAIRARRRFKALVRLIIANLPWLEEMTDQKLGENVKRNVLLLTKKSEKKSLLTIEHKTILNKPAEFRTEAEKLLLYRIIGGLSCFRKYPDRVKMKLASVTYFYYFGPGRVIVRQNHQAYALYFIVTGEVTVSITSFDPVLNKNVTINVGTMVAGNMFGEVSLLHDIPRTATITTATPCELLCLKRADFDVILKSSIEAQWTEIKSAMGKFRYFDGWNVVDMRECCILARKKAYAINEIILGDDRGPENFVYFLIKGQCHVIEHLLLSTYRAHGKKQYKLFIPPVDKPIKEMSKSASVAQIIGDSIDLDESDLGSIQEKPPSLRNSRQTYLSLLKMDETLSESIAPPATPALKTKRKSIIEPNLSSMNLPGNVQTFFMQLCIYSETACFNLGENLHNRRIVATTDVECMLIPKYLIWQKNKGNMWTKIRQFLDSRIPTTEVVFKQFLENRKWKKYKRKLSHSILPYSASNIINNVPYSIRLQEDIEFSEKY